MRRVIILGSTGSIGTQALDVVERSADLEVVGLAAASRVEPLIEQARRYGVSRIALADEESAASEVCEALVWHRLLLSGEPLDDAFVTRTVDGIVLPLLRRQGTLGC